MTRQTLVKTLYITALVLLFCTLHISTAFAQFPESEDQSIVDPDNYFSAPEKNGLAEFMGELPHQYVVVFLDELSEDGREYTAQLFEHYQLSDRHFLLVVIRDKEGSLFYQYGSQLLEDGLTDEIVQTKIENFSKPYLAQNNYITAVRTLIQNIETELESIQEKRAREASTIVEDTPQVEAEAGSEGFPLWLNLLIGLFVLILLLILTSIFVKRKMIKQVDQLETWKITLENRPFSMELARVKGLKMAGETEARFEKWKSEWEDILTTTLPEIEETLIDIEDYADSYRFVKSTRLLKETMERLEQIESSLDKIVEEIDELTSSEKNNRHKIAYLYEEYQELKTLLQKNSIALSVSYPLWHEKFKKASSWFDNFNEAQEGGDYLSANDILEAIEEVFIQVREAVEEIPAFVHEIENNVPAQIREVELAIEEMNEKGYVVEHLQIEQKVEELKKKQEIVSFLENGKITEMKTWVEQKQSEIEQIYHLLEEEVGNKAYVMKTYPLIAEWRQALASDYDQAVKEVEVTKKSYSWDSEWEEALSKASTLCQEIEELFNKIRDCEEFLESKYPMVKPLLHHFEQKRAELFEALQTITEIVSKLREDELKARELKDRLKQSLVKIKVNLRKSNLPGVPEHLHVGIDMAEEAIQELHLALGQIPLDMSRVQHYLQDAKSQVETITQVAKSVIFLAEKAEFCIQYANRYRRINYDIQILIEDAETAFRRYQYKEAVELVEDALDRADKNWKQKLNTDEELSS